MGWNKFHSENILSYPSEPTSCGGGYAW